MVDSLSPDRLRSAIDSSEPLAVLDLRESLDYAEGHIRECTLVRRRELEDRIEELVPNRATPIVLYDRSGDRAALDAAWLERLGYDDVSYLEGGMNAWRSAGYEVVEAVGNVHSTAFNFESKKFGEEVEAREDLPKLQPDELEALRERTDPLVVDVRTPEEYSWVTIPGSLNVEGVDLGLYIDELREDDDQPVVVHCAGRTRSIIGTATLKKLGVENIYELENGTMGWELAGYDPEEGADRRVKQLEVDSDRYRRVQRSAERLLEENDIGMLTPDELDRLDATVDERQTIYRIDVRTRDEYEESHIPGAISIPGGQAIQTTDQHIAVRDAEIVLVSDTHVRSAITAYWFAEMGFERVHVLQGGLSAWTDSGRSTVSGADAGSRLGTELVEGSIDVVTPDELADRLDDERTAIVNVDDSESFRARHVPGSVWIPRYDLETELESGAIDAETIVLTCDDGSVSSVAGAQVAVELGRDDVLVLRGGVDAWEAAGYDLDDGDDGMLVDPRDAVMKPYFQGDAEMRAYLEWEEELATENA